MVMNKKIEKQERKGYRYHYEVYNDNQLMGTAPTKLDAEDMVSDLPCFCASDIEIKRRRITKKKFDRIYNYTFYVMYWNDREDYPVAVFEVRAMDQFQAERIAFENGGDDYEDDWPLLTETGLSQKDIDEYQKSVYTDYYKISA